MVPAEANVEQDPARLADTRRDHGDVGQVRAAVVGVVEHVHVTRRTG